MSEIRCPDCAAPTALETGCTDQDGSSVIVFGCTAGCGGCRQFRAGTGDRVEGTMIDYRHGRTETFRAHGVIIAIDHWSDGQQFAKIQAPLGDPGRGKLFYCPAAELSEPPSLEPSAAQREESLAIAASYDHRRMAHEQACANLKRAEAEGDYWEIRRAKRREEELSNAE